MESDPHPLALNFGKAYHLSPLKRCHVLPQPSQPQEQWVPNLLPPVGTVPNSNTAKRIRGNCETQTNSWQINITPTQIVKTAPWCTNSQYSNYLMDQNGGDLPCLPPARHKN